MTEYVEYTDDVATLDRVANLRHAKLIADAMAPDPKEWSYNGKAFTVSEGMPTKCACGHDIRNVFVIDRLRDGKTLQIGSTCIETTVPSLIASGAENLAIALQEAVAKMKADKEEYERRLREASAAESVQVLEVEWEKLLSFRNDCKNRLHRQYLPYALYNHPQCPKVGKTPAFTAASIRTKYMNLWFDMAHLCVVGYKQQYGEGCPNSYFSKEALPTPTEKKLVDKIVRECDKNISQCQKDAARYATNIQIHLERGWDGEYYKEDLVRSERKIEIYTEYKNLATRNQEGTV